MAEYKISSAILADPDFKSLVIEKTKSKEISEPFLYKTKNGEEFYFFLGENDYLMYNHIPIREGARRLVSLDFFISKEKRKENEIKRKEEEKEEMVEIIIDFEKK